MSEYSLSVDDEALHPILLSDDISWPDIITERDRVTYITHMDTHFWLLFLIMILRLGGHSVFKVYSCKQGNEDTTKKTQKPTLK